MRNLTLVVSLALVIVAVVAALAIRQNTSVAIKLSAAKTTSGAASGKPVALSVPVAQATTQSELGDAAGQANDKVISALSASGFRELAMAFGVDQSEIGLFAEIISKARTTVLTAMAESAQVRALDSHTVAMVTKLTDTQAAEFESQVRRQLEDLLGAERVATAYKNKGSDELDSVMGGFGKTERSYVFEGDGPTLASSQTIAHELKFQTRNSFGTFIASPKGTYISIEEFRKAAGPLADRALKESRSL